MSRGSVTIKLLPFMLALLLVSLVNLWTSGSTEVHVFKKGLTEALVIEGTNIMEFLKKSLQQSLIYSYYQASYEVAKNGGNLQSIPTWRNYSDTNYPSNFQEILADRTRKILNQYVVYLKEPSIALNEYQAVKIEKGNNGLENVEAFSDKDLGVSKFNYELKNSANVFVSIPVRTLALFEIGKQDFVDKDLISSAIQAAESSLPSTCSRVSIPDYCETPPSCESYYSNNCQVQFESGIRSQISTLEGTTDGINKELNVNEIKSTHIPQGPFATADGQCCVSGHTEESCTDVCTGEGEARKCTTECSSVFVCDVSGTKYVNAYCEFKHVGSASILAKISDATNKYPVYDPVANEVSINNLQLNFNVISSNDYSQKLIQ